LRRESVSDLTSCFTGLGVASQSAAVMSSDIQSSG
jgi:transcriptional regulatory protein LevR